MKNLFYCAICVFALTFTFASCNNGGKSNILFENDSLLLKQLTIYQEQLRKPPFKLYPTRNMYTFLELNTATGQIWIVQWSAESKTRFKYVLDDNIRIENINDLLCGRFELHPTDNIYNFILLDNVSGSCWQVQWSFEEENRMVVPII